MVINEHELITNNQETSDDNLISTSSEQTIKEENTTITDQSNQTERSEEIKITEQPEQEEINEQNKENENAEHSIETKNTDTSEESIENSPEQKETAETNCLALTVRKNYNVSIIKNSIFTSLRFSLKVAISTLVLNILKLFL